MLANFVKTLSLTNRTHLRFTYELTRRQLCSGKENIDKHSLKKDEDDMSIAANLFEQSSLKFEPVSAEKILRESKQKFTPAKNIPVAKKSVPIKKTRLERSAESKVINDKELGLEFTKLSLNDPLLTSLLTTARSKKRRDKDRQIIVEGRRLILEALECGLKLNTIIFSQKDSLSAIKEQVARYGNKAHIYKVPQHDLKIWSTLTTPPGVMAVFERPSLEYVEKVSKLSSTSSSPQLPVTVVCDNIREPNNLGSIIRTCAALPCYQIVVTKGCCDPWESKALRGGCGGHFRVPLRDNVDWVNVASTIPPEVADDCCVFVAENNLEKVSNKTVVDYAEIEKIGLHNVVIIGGESHGVSAEAYKFMANVGSKGKCVYIPLAKGVDSLNVASALILILYELRKCILNRNIIASSP